MTRDRTEKHVRLVIMIEETLKDLVRSLGCRKLLRKKVRRLSASQLDRSVRELMCHVEVHIARHCFAQADALLRLARRLAGHLETPELSRQLERLRVSWLEAQDMHDHSARKLSSIYDRLQNSGQDGAETHDDEYAGRILMDMIMAYSRAGYTSKALQAVGMAAELFSLNDDKYNMAAAGFNKASLFYDQGNYAKSANLCIELLPAAEKYQDVSAKLLQQLGNNLEAMHQPNHACQFYGKAMSLYHNMSDMRQQSEIAGRIGWLMLKRENFDLSYRCLRASYFLKTELEYRKSLLNQHYYQAEALYEMGLPERARSHYLISIALAERLKAEEFLTQARQGFYKTRGAIVLNLRSAMTATAVTISNTNRSQYVTGFRRYRNDGYALPSWPDGSSRRAEQAKERSKIKMLIGDLSFCAEAADSPEAKFFHTQNQYWL